MQKETLLSFQTPNPKKIPSSLCAYGRTWVDPYRWMSNTGDPNLVNHLHNENSYAEAFMADTQTLRRRLVAEMKARMPAKIVTPPESWGDWGGGGDSSWHHAGSGLHKLNSMHDFAACGSYLISEGAIGGNFAPMTIKKQLQQVPFLDTCNTMLDPTLPLTTLDYEEFGDPAHQIDFDNIRSYSLYDNIPLKLCYPLVLVTASFYDSRVGFWASAKWVARVREITCPSCSRPVILKTHMSGEHFGEGGSFQHCEETAFEYAFLIKAIGRVDGEMSSK